MVSQTELDLQVRNDELETRIAKLERQLGSLWNAGLDRLAESGYLQFDGIAMRWDDKGMQIETGAEDATAISYVDKLTPDPSTASPIVYYRGNVSSANGEATGSVVATNTEGDIARLQVSFGASQSEARLGAARASLSGTPAEIVCRQTTSAGIVRVADASFALAADISPSQITGNQNNYAPTGLHFAAALRLTTDASRDITGIEAPPVLPNGRLLVVLNVGSFDIVLKDESASSAAANRFALNGDLTLQSDNSVILWYDSTSSRWRAV